MSFSKALKELRVHFCQTSPASNGIRYTPRCVPNLKKARAQEQTDGGKSTDRTGQESFRADTSFMDSWALPPIAPCYLLQASNSPYRGTIVDFIYIATWIALTTYPE